MLKILIAASEVAPFAKTGGLADVASALPAQLHELGHDVRVVMPKYASIDEDRYRLLPMLGDINVWMDGQQYVTYAKRTTLPGTKLPVYFIQSEEFFDREGLYGEGGTDYPDNYLRFAVFCKAIIWMLKGLDWVPDIIHCNDWQTALIPVYLATQGDMLEDAELRRARVLFTIHNLAYQGVITHEQAAEIDLSGPLVSLTGLEFYGKANLLKGGLLYCHAISTVSPTYAREIMTPEFGCGLDGVIREVRSKMTGILNGADYSQWDPTHDAHIPATFSAADPTGKQKCKQALQKAFGAPPQTDLPLIGMVSRLDSQKGFDIIAQVLDDLVALPVQLVFLGTGAPEYHALLKQYAAAHPDKIAVRLAFDEGLAHLVEAGADIFLMPSRFEPCGLNQMYSLRYGTLPIVRRVGGLADTITDATPETLANATANGFVFEDYTGSELLITIRRALAVYAQKDKWAQMMRTAMAADFSWQQSSAAYLDLYARLLGYSNS